MKRKFPDKFPGLPGAKVQAAYDVAQTTDSNSRHWANADSLSPKLTNSPEVRRTIRQRARYEILENNCYGKGIVLTLANDTIGTGPRLQLRTEDAEVNAKIEQQWADWCKAVGLAPKFRAMRVAKGVDGETFAHFATNDKIRHPVKLDLMVSESDYFTSPYMKSFDSRIDDGIEYDAMGNPIRYYRQKYHPGGELGYVNFLEHDILPADQVIHLYRCDRPGQTRGVSEFVTSLSIFAQLRAWTQAQLDAAKFAASVNAVMNTNSSAISDPDDVEALDAIPFERNSLLTMPKGWGISQIKSEHPNPQSETFERLRVREIARCVNMPLIIALGDSTDANYSSGRLDHQTYFKSIRVERGYWEQACIDRIFLAWLQEAVLIPGYVPDEVRAIVRAGILPPHEWFWDGFRHVDPEKEGNAQTILLGNGTTSRDAAYAEQGLDIEQEDQRAAASFGVTVEEYRKALFNKVFEVAPPPPEPQETEEVDVAEEVEAAMSRFAVEPPQPPQPVLVQPTFNIPPAPLPPVQASPPLRKRLVKRDALGLIASVEEVDA